MGKRCQFAGLSIEELEALLCVAKKRVRTLERLIAQQYDHEPAHMKSRR